MTLPSTNPLYEDTRVTLLRELTAALLWLAFLMLSLNCLVASFSWGKLFLALGCLVAAYIIWPSKRRGERRDDSWLLDLAELLIEAPKLQKTLINPALKHTGLIRANHLNVILRAVAGSTGFKAPFFAAHLGHMQSGVLTRILLYASACSTLVRLYYSQQNALIAVYSLGYTG
jgi:hypothetical protein